MDKFVSPFRSGGNGTKQVCAILFGETKSPIPNTSLYQSPLVSKHYSQLISPESSVTVPGSQSGRIVKPKISFSSEISKIEFLDVYPANRSFVHVQQCDGTSYYGILATHQPQTDSLLIQPLRRYAINNRMYYRPWDKHLWIAKYDTVKPVEMSSSPFGYILSKQDINDIDSDAQQLITLEDSSNDGDDDNDDGNENGVVQNSHSRASPVFQVTRSIDDFQSQIETLQIQRSALDSGEGELYWQEEADEVSAKEELYWFEEDESKAFVDRFSSTTGDSLRNSKQPNARRKNKRKRWTRTTSKKARR